MYPRLAHFGPVILPTYSVLSAVGLVCALLLAEWSAPRAGLSRERVWRLCIAVLVSTVLVSRALLAYELMPAFKGYPRLVLSLPTLTPWGPLIVVGCTAIAIAVLRLPWLATLDAVTPACLLLLTALHLGSFFAGDDPGSGTLLAVGNLVPGDEGHHPVALYAAALATLTLVAALVTLVRRHHAGWVFGVGLAGAAIARFVADEFRPLYLLPKVGATGFLRGDQWLLLALVVGGFLLLLPGRPHHAK